MQQAVWFSELRQFCQQVFHQIQIGGWRVFAHKVRSLLRRALFLAGTIAAGPLVLLIVAIRPYVLVRFGRMRSERIGHFALDVEAYLCALDRKRPHRYTDYIYCPEPVCNRHLRKMWARVIRISPGISLWEILNSACLFWTRGESHHIQLSGRYKDYRLFSASDPHLSFTKEEHQWGQELLDQLGIPPGSLWICIHNRDSAYLDQALVGRWAYQDYRDFSVQTMIAAADELSSRGYYVVRMGSVVAERLISENTKVIDYASGALRSDFADIYVLANCSAYMGSDSGISCLALLFRKPNVFINQSATLINHLRRLACHTLPFITKRLWHKEKQRFLGIREMFEVGLDGASMSDSFEEAGVEPVCNAPEEIRDLAIEVDERLKGYWQPQSGDEELQQRFWAIFRAHSPAEGQGGIQPQIGAAFLRKHLYLLD